MNCYVCDTAEATAGPDGVARCGACTGSLQKEARDAIEAARREAAWREAASARWPYRPRTFSDPRGAAFAMRYAMLSQQWKERLASDKETS